MSNECDDAAVGWDGDEAVRSYIAAAHTSLLAVLARADKSLDGAKVLDFGCGTGLLTERLAPVCWSIDAVDMSQAVLAVLDAKVEQRGWTHVMTRNTVPTEPESYDLIVCSSVCSFLDDYPATLADLAILLVPGGLFVQWDWERDDSDDDPPWSESSRDLASPWRCRSHLNDDRHFIRVGDRGDDNATPRRCTRHVRTLNRSGLAG